MAGATTTGGGGGSGGGGNNSKRGGGSSSASSAASPSENGGNTNNRNGSIAMQELSQLRHLIAHPQQQVVLTCYIPPNRVGAVIGRKGASIINLQREAARRSCGHTPGTVRISVLGGHSVEKQKQERAEQAQASHHGGGGSGSGSGSNRDRTASAGSEDDRSGSQQVPAVEDNWTPVIIRGDPCGAFAAAELLLPLIEYEMDDVVLDVPLPRHRHSIIIGRKGHTIAMLSADHNVRIMVPHKNYVPPEKDSAESPTVVGNSASGSGGDRKDSTTGSGAGTANLDIVQLEGECGNVERCLAKMLQVLSGPQRGDRDRGDGGRTGSLSADATSSGEIGAESSGDGKRSQQQHQASPHRQQQRSSGQHDDSATCPASGATGGRQADSTGKNSKSSVIEVTITAPSDDMVPSLARLRQIGKRTNTIIRRKRVQLRSRQGSRVCDDVDTEPVANNEGETDEDHEEAATDVEGVAPVTEKNEVTETAANDQEAENASALADKRHDTQFIISGRADNVAAAKNLFERLFAGESVDSIVDSAVIVPTDEKGGSGNSKKQGKGGRSGKKGGGGRGGSKNRGGGGRSQQQQPQSTVS